MKISYRELDQLLKLFNLGYNGDNSTMVFLKESRPTYLPPRHEYSMWYLRYIYLPNKNTEFNEPLTVTFDDEDFKIIKSSSDKTLHAIFTACDDYGFVNVDKRYERYDYPKVSEDVLAVINKVFDLYWTKDKSCAVCINPSLVNGMNAQQACATIIEYVSNTYGSGVSNKWRHLVFSDEFKDFDVLFQLFDGMKKLHITLHYYSREYYEYVNAKKVRLANEKANTLASQSYCDVFDETWMDGYEDFAKNYGTYQQVYNHLLECFNKRASRSRHRFFINDTSKVSRIKCIEYLLAWITITEGFCFIFEADSLSNNYHKFMQEMISGSMLASDLRFRISINLPVINDNNWKLAIAELSFNTESKPVPTPVVVTGIKRQIRNWKAVPLSLITREIKCTHDIDNLKNTKKAFFGFYPGNSIVDRNDLISGSEYNLSSFDPVNICDFLIDDFQNRCRVIKANLEKIHASQDLIKFYDISNYEKLFESYLYSFSVIFSHYVGNDSWYSLNNIFILKMDYKGFMVDVACVIDFSTEYMVKPFIFLNGKPYLSPESSISTGYIYSPEFLIDYEERVVDSIGVDYGQINTKLVECVRIMERSKPDDKAMGVSKQLETKGVKSVSIEEAINYDTVSNYFYPVINLHHIYNNVLVNNTLTILPTDFINDIDRYAMELISANYHRFTTNTGRYRDLHISADKSVAVVGHADYTDYLRDFICRGLCDIDAVNDRNSLNEYFSSPLFNFNGFRFISYKDSYVKWNGKISNSIRGPLFPSIHPAFIRGRR